MLSVLAAAGRLIPFPAWEMLMAARPMNRARVVTISK